MTYIRTRHVQPCRYWQLPVAVAAADVETATELANLGVALPAVNLPLTLTLDSSDAIQTEATQQAPSELLQTLAALSVASVAATGCNDEAPMTPIVNINACATDSDSILRFAAYRLSSTILSVPHRHAV